MITININAKSTKQVVEQIQDSLGGIISEQWGEHILHINNNKAKGSIRFVTFDWGVNLLEYDIIFNQEVCLDITHQEFNPINFVYCLNGEMEHHFGHENNYKTIHQFQSVVISNKVKGETFAKFPAHKKLEINILQIKRNQFIKKRLNNLEALNEKLHDAFMDKDLENRFAFYGTTNLKLANEVQALRNIKGEGMIRVMLIECGVYQILSSHILQHDAEACGKKVETSLNKKDMKIVHKVSKQIVENPADDYCLDDMENEYGLQKAKLQEGFKIIFNRTVTEYIRHIRLKTARDLMDHTDYNVSQIVYSVGFSSRSYFSKIFKQKYKVSPSEYLKTKHHQMVIGSVTSA